MEVNVDEKKDDNGEYHRADDSNEMEEKNELGVDGQFQWPVRIISFIVFVGAVAINYIIGR